MLGFSKKIKWVCKTSNHLLVIVEVINTSIWLFTDGLLNLVVETVCAHERVAFDKELQVKLLDETLLITHLVSQCSKQNPVLVLACAVIQPQGKMFGMHERGMA